MLSLSSCFLSEITSFRNPNGPEQRWTKIPVELRLTPDPLKKAVAEVGYFLVIPFSIIETAISAIAKLFSALLPMEHKRHEAMTDWLMSSAFSIRWSLEDTAINLHTNDMVVSEKVARANVFRARKKSSALN
jgi:hypothetical protein